MYKDRDQQKQASKEAMRRYRAKQKGITDKGITNEGITGVPDVIPAKLTQEDINKMSADEVQALLNSWAEGKGTVYQQRLAILGRQYSVIKGA